MDNPYFIPIMLSGTILFLLFLFFIVFYMIYHKRRIQQEYMAKEKLIYDHNLSMLTARLQEQEGAMSQISREIHDNVSQKVDFLQMNSKALKEATTEASSKKIMDNISSLAEQIGNDLRNISYTLNSDYITAHGLVAVLKKELDYISSSRTITCNMEVIGEFPDFAPDTELLIYRIIQEALHNSIKHADPSRIDIIAANELGAFQITVKDNGKGFDIDATNYKAGLGFKNMQQRALLLEATLVVTAIPGESCEVTLAINKDAMCNAISGELLPA